jgi:hypothetical protein
MEIFGSENFGDFLVDGSVTSGHASNGASNIPPSFWQPVCIIFAYSMLLLITGKNLYNPIPEMATDRAQRASWQRHKFKNRILCQQQMVEIADTESTRSDTSEAPDPKRIEFMTTTNPSSVGSSIPL